MPQRDILDGILLHISTAKAAHLAAMPAGGRHPMPLADLIRQCTSDRLRLAGDHLGGGDNALLNGEYRFSISRHYYAMYHAARGVVFAVVKGDDYEAHRILPRHLPANLNQLAVREAELTNARLLRNEADYDLYPGGHASWQVDARALSVTAAEFVAAFEAHALTNGLI